MNQKQPSWRTATGSSSERGYNYAWQKARKRFLQMHPLCVMCLPDKVTRAEVVDHITPHKGDQTLFWDEANWQALCKPHHDSDKQRIERGLAQRTETGVDGWPM